MAPRVSKVRLLSWCTIFTLTKWYDHGSLFDIKWPSIVRIQLFKLKKANFKIFDYSSVFIQCLWLENSLFSVIKSEMLNQFPQE